jgi:hypothetical protein
VKGDALELRQRTVAAVAALNPADLVIDVSATPAQPVIDRP